MKNNLREELNPYLGEEVITKMRAEKSNPPPTLAELIVESRQEGKKEGKEEVIKDIVIALIRKNYSDQEIMKITELTTAELEAIRERSEEHTSELQSRFDIVCRLLLEKKKI